MNTILNTRFLVLAFRCDVVMVFCVIGGVWVALAASAVDWIAERVRRQLTRAR